MRSGYATISDRSFDARHLQGVEPGFVEQSRRLRQRVNARAEYGSRLQLQGATEAVAAVTTEIDTITLDYQQLESSIRARSPRYVAITQSQPLNAAEIQRLLDEDTLLLEYSLGNERSYLWAVSPASITSYQLPPRREIESAARRVYDLLNAPSRRPKHETDAQHRSRVARAVGLACGRCRVLDKHLDLRAGAFSWRLPSGSNETCENR